MYLAWLNGPSPFSHARRSRNRGESFWEIMMISVDIYSLEIKYLRCESHRGELTQKKTPSVENKTKASNPPSLSLFTIPFPSDIRLPTISLQYLRVQKIL